LLFSAFMIYNEQSKKAVISTTQTTKANNEKPANGSKKLENIKYITEGAKEPITAKVDQEKF
jgi:hypothetical protein